MANIHKLIIGIITALLLTAAVRTDVLAAPTGEIADGVYAGNIDLSGKTLEQAVEAVNETVASRDAAQITLTDGLDYSVSFTGADIDYTWKNTDVLNQAATLGKTGNIVKRYKELKDLSRTKQVYTIEYSFDEQKLKSILADCALEYDREAVNTSMIKTEEGFDITEGNSGRELDQDATFNTVSEFLLNDWDGLNTVINMDVEVVEPLGSYEDLSMVKDILGTYTTSYSTSSSARCANVANACSLINGTLLYPGEEFSTLATITPFSTENGYFMAGSYFNGQVVESLGGGICQVSTTLYNAVLLSELDVVERHNHSMIIGYVKPSMDAAIAESANKDFKFTNNTDYPIYIEGYTTTDKKITFNIYGVETRPSTHQVTYESEVLSTDVPETDAVYTDAGQPAGYKSAIQSAHIGYKARLWKNTYENGNLESRVEINSSSYNKSPRSITIGVATDNADIYNMLMEAAASGNADTAAAAADAAAAMQPAAPAAEAAPAQETPAAETSQDNPPAEGE